MNNSSENEVHVCMDRDQLPGIPGIDGIKLNYGSWHLLNEGLACFLNNHYYACIACLGGSLELWLKRKLGMHAREKFRKFVKEKCEIPKESRGKIEMVYKDFFNRFALELQGPNMKEGNEYA